MLEYTIEREILCNSCREGLQRQLSQTDLSEVRVICSPLTRTLDTAVIIAEQLGIHTTDSRFQV
jgi:broad specificity phosphatase PhoE